MSGRQYAAVSVILTCYNQAQFVATALESVFHQTLDEVEIIIVDDGSTDGSLELLTEIAGNCEKTVRICTHPGHENRGIAETYFRGISEASAPLIAFLEGDDSWSPNYLEEKVRLFQQYPEVGVVFSPLRIKREDGYGADMVFRQAVLRVLFPRKRAFNNFNNLLRHNNVATFSTFMVRSSLARSLPRPNAARLPYLDWWVLLQLSMRTAFYFDEQSHTRWRLSRTSFMGRISFQDHKAGLVSFFDEMYANVEENIACLAKSDIARFRRRQRSMTLFTNFYVAPSVPGFFRLFSRDPRWALETVASYFVNSIKHS